MAGVRLATYLRHLLLQLPRELDEGPLSYRDVIRPESEEALLRQFLDSTLQSGHGRGVAMEREYVALLLSKVLLTSFELLCTSMELFQEVEYSYAEFEKILLSVEQLNSIPVVDRSFPLPTKKTSCQRIELSSLIEAYLKARVRFLTSALSNKPSIEFLLQVIELEHGFSRAFLAMTATYTSLLSITDKDRLRKRRFVSAKVFSMNSSPTVTWSDCLIPGAQSDTLRRACTEVFSTLWNRVAEVLIARAQPLLPGGWTMEQFVPWLRTTLNIKGKLILIGLLDATSIVTAHFICC